MSQTEILQPVDAEPDSPPRTGIDRIFDRRVILLGVLGFAALASVMPRLKSTSGDQLVYTKAGQRVLNGEQFYRPDDPPAFSYPPFFVLPFLPLVHLSDPVRRGIWYFCNFLLLSGSLLLILKHTRQWWAGFYEKHPRLYWLIPISLTLLSARSLFSPIENQGHDLIIFLMMVLTVCAWAKGRDLQAGLFAGLGAALKVTPALFLPVFLWQRRFKAAGVLCAVGLVCTLLPDLFFTNPHGELWAISWAKAFVFKVDLGAAANAPGAWAAWNPLNQSFSGTVHRLFTPAPAYVGHLNIASVELSAKSLKAIILAGQLSIFAWLFWVTRPRLSSGLSPQQLKLQRWGEAGAILCCMLLLSPMTSKQHFCVFLIPLTFIVYDAVERGLRRWVILAMTGIFCLSTLAVKDFIGQHPGNLLLAMGSLTWCAVICLGTTGALLISRSREFSALNEQQKPLTETTPAQTLAA